MAKQLVVERPHEEPKEMPWTKETQTLLCLDAGEIERLEAGKIVWLGDTGLTLEEV